MHRVIRAWLARYVGGTITLQDFLEWFEPNTWDLDLEDAELRKLYGEIELDLAEYTNGDWTEDELRALLRQALLPGDTST